MILERLKREYTRRFGSAVSPDGNIPKSIVTQAELMFTLFKGGETRILTKSHSATVYDDNEIDDFIARDTQPEPDLDINDLLGEDNVCFLHLERYDCYDITSTSSFDLHYILLRDPSTNTVYLSSAIESSTEKITLHQIPDHILVQTNSPMDKADRKYWSYSNYKIPAFLFIIAQSVAFHGQDGTSDDLAGYMARVGFVNKIDIYKVGEAEKKRELSRSTVPSVKTAFIPS